GHADPVVSVWRLGNRGLPPGQGILGLGFLRIEDYSLPIFYCKDTPTLLMPSSPQLCNLQTSTTNSTFLKRFHLNNAVGQIFELSLNRPVHARPQCENRFAAHSAHSSPD